MTIPTGSNLYSEVWNIAYALISGNVTDPALSSRSSNKLKMIFGAFPDLETTRPDFPLIVIDNPQADTKKTTGFSTGGILNKDVTLSIWAYSKSNQQMNVLADAITNAFTANRSVMMGSGLTFTGITNGAFGTDIVGNDRVHYREIQPKFIIAISGA